MRLVALLLPTAVAATRQEVCTGTAPATDAWCNENCNAQPPNCPGSLCTCTSGGNPPGPGPSPPSSGCSQCSAPDNCYHPTWGSPCSTAGSQSECEASSSGAVWCPAAPPSPTPPPAPKGAGFVGGYLGLYAADGLKRLQALAGAADTIPLTRIWLAFVSPTMVYAPGSKTLSGAGIGIPTIASDAGFADVAAAVKTLEAAGVEVFVSMGGWNYNCFPYFYTRYSVGGYGDHTPNFWKVQQYAGGDLDKCTRDNQYCYTCEPESEHADVDLSFSIFPEPGNSSGWKAAQQYVEAGAGTTAPKWHSDIVPGSMTTDSKTGTSVKVPGSGAFAAQGRDPYQDLVFLAKDLGASGVDIDYEEFWHADTFKLGDSDTGPWELPHTVYKYAAIVKDTMDAIKANAPSMKLSTASGAVGAWSGKWWGGNMKGVWLQTKQMYPEVISFMADGANAGGVNVMTYDLSSNEDFHECPEDGVCSLDKQVDFYMDTYATAGITANVGYEVGTPAYPDPVHDASHQLPLTKEELSTLIAGAQAKTGGGFFWEMYKPAGNGQASPTDVAQAICNAVLPGNSRCSGTIPQL